MSATNSTIESMVLRRVATLKQTALEEALGKDASTVSRIISGERGLKLSELDPLFKALGLSVICTESGVVTIPREEFAALRTLARISLEKQGDNK